MRHIRAQIFAKIVQIHGLKILLWPSEVSFVSQRKSSSLLAKMEDMFSNLIMKIRLLGTTLGRVKCSLSCILYSERIDY